jgi:hypothetical protein
MRNIDRNNFLADMSDRIKSLLRNFELLEKSFFLCIKDPVSSETRLTEWIDSTQNLSQISN